MKLKAALLCLTALALLAPSLVSAKSGCCSHHGGVCGCGCCDGSLLSYTCAPYYPGCNGEDLSNTLPEYIPIPDFPQASASWLYSFNNDKTINVDVTLNDSSPTQYSAVISKCAGCDPGPKTDFTLPTFHFYNLTPGRWYLNTKKEIGGVWSKISYFTIDVPSWISPTAKYEYPTQAMVTSEIEPTEEIYMPPTMSDLAPYGLLGLTTIVGGVWLLKKS